MSKVDQLFEKLRSRGQKAFVPFVTAGDPDLQFTAAVLRELANRGCSLCEVGVPYSDPIADGPVIQASYTRALSKGVRVAQILNMISAVAADLTTPLVTMVSYAIIHRYGLDRYVADAKAAGIAGAIVPDLLVEEASSFREICQREDFSLIQLVTPTTPRQRAVRIAQMSTGFLYYVSVTGITGERSQLPTELTDSVGWLRGHTDLPICIGFGISRPEHVKLLAPVADGLIVGSAFVRRIADADGRPRREVLEEVGRFADLLLQAMAD
jgi:tryptophan synthase alpha chain